MGEYWIPTTQVGPVQVSVAASGAVDLLASEPRPDHPIPAVHIPAEVWPNVIMAVTHLQAAFRAERLREAVDQEAAARG